MNRLLAVAVVMVAALAGCNYVPQVITPYRMEIQQGNFLSQQMVSQLKPGLTKEQVRFLLGTPLLIDPFHANRWDYVFYREAKGGTVEHRQLSVFFEDDRLTRVTGDAKPAGSNTPAADTPAADTSKAGVEQPDAGKTEAKN